jgi:hypothetical protein
LRVGVNQREQPGRRMMDRADGGHPAGRPAVAATASNTALGRALLTLSRRHSVSP